MLYFPYLTYFRDLRKINKDDISGIFAKISVSQFSTIFITYYILLVSVLHYYARATIISVTFKFANVKTILTIYIRILNDYHCDSV